MGKYLFLCLRSLSTTTMTQIFAASSVATESPTKWRWLLYGRRRRREEEEEEDCFSVFVILHNAVSSYLLSLLNYFSRVIALNHNYFHHYIISSVGLCVELRASGLLLDVKGTANKWCNLWRQRQHCFKQNDWWRQHKYTNSHRDTVQTINPYEWTHRCNYTTAMDIQLQKRATKGYSHSFRIACEKNAVSLLGSGE